jgi:hypothetical protein
LGAVTRSGQDQRHDAEPSKPGEHERDESLPPHGTVVSQLKA